MVWTSQNFSVPCTGTTFLSGLKECLVYLAFVIHEKINKQALAVLIFPPFINTSSWYVLPAAKPSKFALSFTDKMKQLFPVMNNCRTTLPAVRLQVPTSCTSPAPFPLLLRFAFLRTAPRDCTETRQGGRLNALFPLIESISLTQQWLLCASLPEGGVCVWPLKLVHGHSFIPQQWYEISLCYNSILMKWCYHSNKICCCPFIPFQSICVYSPFCNHWTWVSAGKKSVRTKIRKDYTPATN